MRHLIVVFMLLLSFSSLARPKIGLVLSGGGARGGAHIGIIEVLEALEVPIDMIVGTSMGAVIGGLYAAGVPIHQIKRDFCALDWEKIFNSDIKRTDLYFRRKLDNDLFVIEQFVGFLKGQPRLSTGLIYGQNLYTLFKSYILPLEPFADFAQLPIPFKAVATDLLTGKSIVLENGDLGLALLASMAVPGIISPISMDQYLLADGGVSSNLPIEIIKDMGADILIVVNTSTPLADKEKIFDLITILGQITTIYTNNNVHHSLSFLSPQDILITPALHIETTDFTKFYQAISLGEEAAYAQKEKLSRLSYPQQPKVTSSTPPVVDEKSIQHDSLIRTQVYQSFLSAPFSDIKQRVDALYGLNVFEHIYYGIHQQQGINQLVVKPQEKDPHTYYLQGSLLFESNFKANDYFALSFGLTRPQINSLLGEWRIIGSIGQGAGLFAEFYQPLTPDLSWFINPYLSIERERFNFYYDFEQTASFLNTSYQAGLGFGKLLSNWGQLKLDLQWMNNDFKQLVGFSSLPQGHFPEGALSLAFDWDTLDNFYFPHRGNKGNLTLSHHQNFEEKNHFSQLSLRHLVALSHHRHALVLAGEYHTTLAGNPTLHSQFFLGGLFKLSGLLDKELFANNSLLLSSVYFYEWSKINLLANRSCPLYVGASLEAGTLSGNSNLSHPTVIGATSLFLGVDTLIGPIYLAVGVTNQGKQAIHFIVRPTFK